MSTLWEPCGWAKPHNTLSWAWAMSGQGIRRWRLEPAESAPLPGGGLPYLHEQESSARCPQCRHTEGDTGERHWMLGDPGTFYRY